MNEFLNTLARFLKHMNAQQKQDIIDDYREHFEAGLEAGKTEQEVSAALGDPIQLAKMHTMQNTSITAHESKGFGDTIRMIGAALSYKAGGGILVGCLYFVCLSGLVSLFAIAAGLALIGVGCIVLMAVEIGASYLSYAALALFAALVFSAGGLLLLKGSTKLWRLSLGRMPLLARCVMHMEKETVI